MNKAGIKRACKDRRILSSAPVKYRGPTENLVGAVKVFSKVILIFREKLVVIMNVF